MHKFKFQLLADPGTQSLCQILGVAALYGLAKVAEYFDHGIFQATSQISGHSLKHLIAAYAVYQIVRMLQMRSRVA